MRKGVLGAEHVALSFEQLDKQAIPATVLSMDRTGSGTGKPVGR